MTKISPAEWRRRSIRLARPLLILPLLLLVVTGCCTSRNRNAEDPEIAARCSPVKDLLSKNYHRDGAVDLAVVKLGGLYSRTGAVLSGEEAANVYTTDQLCRAWVLGALSGREYAAALMKLASVTIVQTSDPAERDALIASISRILDDMKTKGIVPPDFDPGRLKEQVAGDAKLAPATLDQTLRDLLAALGPNMNRFFADGAANQVELLKRLDALDARVARLEPQPLGGVTATPPGVVAPAQLDIYFSTGSAEVPYDARVRLREAARLWAAGTYSVRVTGYADPRGALGRNKVLSLRRAEAVAAILERAEVAVSKVSAGGVGRGTDENDLLRFVRVQRDSP